MSSFTPNKKYNKKQTMDREMANQPKTQKRAAGDDKEICEANPI